MNSRSLSMLMACMSRPTSRNWVAAVDLGPRAGAHDSDLTGCWRSGLSGSASVQTTITGSALHFAADLRSGSSVNNYW